MNKQTLHPKWSSIFLPTLSLLLLCLLVVACKKDRSDRQDNEPINHNYSKKDTINRLLEEYAAKGIPGLAVSVYSGSEGWWETARGFENVETRSPMQPSHLHYLQSVSKTYMAVGILKLWEEGRIDLDQPMTKYLPKRFADRVTNASQVTIRNLLNHQSGVADYTVQPEYVEYVLQHPDHLFSSEELISFIKDKPSLFTPGSKYEYCNTNFELLAFVADSITGNHSNYLYQKIIRPLGLQKTYYRYDSRYPNYPALPQSYIDFYGNGNIENVSLMQRMNIASMVGDDGMIATPRDAVRFLKGLFEGKLLGAAAMQQMKTWVKDEFGEDIMGMGLFRVEAGGIVGYGHGGSGIGEGCGLYYFPAKEVYVFMGTNLGTILGGPLAEEVDELKLKLLSVLLDI